MPRIRMLGPLDVGSADQPVTLGGPRQSALFAMLLVHRGRRVSADEMTEAVWTGDARAGAVKRAQVAVARLRRSLVAIEDAARIETVAGGYRLEVAADEVDADVFSAAVARAQAALEDSDPARAAATLRDGLALWRGPALAGVDALFARAEAGVLEDLRLRALELRVDADLRLGRHRELTGELEALTASHPERESLVAALMLALYRGGRQAEALEAFRSARERLSAELGLEPGPALRALQARILAHDESLELVAARERAGPTVDLAAAVESDDAHRGGPASPLVGREQDIAAVVELLHRPDVRLVSILGPGGVGKTALARAIVQRLAGSPRFVDLIAAPDVDAVPSLMLAAVGASVGAPGPPARRLRDALALREQTLVLDNFEHVLGAAPMIAELLEAAPRLRIVVTTRVALGLRVERRYPLAPLALAEEHGAPSAVAASPSAELFVARARDRDPAFALTAENTAAVAAICDRAGGLPLALELAAARVPALAVGDIARRLTRGGLDLASDLRDVPERQRSLRATLDWSVGLLAPAEREAFASFAVFVGGARPDDAEAVLVTDLAVIEGLVASSLLTPGDTPHGSRLAMLEPVREYAAECLAGRSDADGVRRRHAERFLALAERGREGLDGPEWVDWRDRLEADLDNIRAALAWATTRPCPRVALGLASVMRTFLVQQGRGPESYRWLTAALALGGSDALRARALVERSRIDWDEIPTEDSAADARRALHLFRALGDAGGAGDCLLSLAILEERHRRHAAAVRLRAEAQVEWETAGRAAPPAAIAFDTSLVRGVEDAVAAARSASARLMRDGAVRYVTSVLSNAALGAIEGGRYGAALALLDEALEIAQAESDAPMIAMIRGNEGFAALGLHDDDRAEQALIDELRICRVLGHLDPVPASVLGVACVACGRGETARAALLAGAARAGFARREHHPGYQRLLDWTEATWLAPARASAPDAWDAASRRGERLSDVEALEAALGAAAGT